MDLLSGLTSLLGGVANQSGAQQQQYGAQQQGGGGLESMLGGLLGSLTGGGQGGQAGMSQQGNLGALGALLNPAVLGGLANALMGGGGRASANAGGLGSLLGALMGGGAATPGLDMHQSAVAADPRYGAQAASAPQDRVVRMLRAMIYAARADGHIDDSEQNAIAGFMQKNNIGPEGARFIQGLMQEPLDPNAIANGLQDSREAVQIYGLSCAVCGNDNPDERRYLDSLAAAMRIPANVKADIEGRLQRA